MLQADLLPQRSALDQLDASAAQPAAAGAQKQDLPFDWVAFDEFGDGAFAPAEPAFGADAARKLALIRQDLATFAIDGGETLNRFNRDRAELVDWYA